MKHILAILILSLAAGSIAFGTDMRGPRNRSSGGKDCQQVNISGTMTDELCLTSTGAVIEAGVNGPLTVGSDSSSAAREIELRAGSAQRATINFWQNGTNISIVSTASGSNDLTPGSAVGDLVIRAVSKNILFTPDNGSTTTLKIDTAGNTVGTGFATTYGSTSMATGTPTNIGTAMTAGRWEISCWLPSINNYFSFGTVVYDGANPRLVANNASNSSLSVSGANVACQQISGGTQTMRWTMTRIGVQ